MGKSSTTIINHIPQFLLYCQERGYSHNTQLNYKMYLQKFILWLNSNKKHNLMPHEFKTDDVASYRSFLSGSTRSDGRILKDVTQNYYLIALRALLSYFVVKDIDSLLPAKITLSRPNKSGKTLDLLTVDQIAQLLLAPDTKTMAGLRDRAILEIIISSGLKINQIVSLNVDKLDGVSEAALIWVKKYLTTRNDKNKALFINYRGNKKSAGGRLTPRSIERTIKYYGEKIESPLLITPETLRWARFRATSDQIIKIQIPHTHQTFNIKEYNYRADDDRNYSINQSPTWDNIEDLIKNEMSWLKKNIPVLPQTFRTDHSFLKCDDCIFRKIAILIISGRVNAKELLVSDGKNLWDNSTSELPITKISHHGKDWHKKMMDTIYNYFKIRGHEVIMEPALNYGRADLGICLRKNRIYVEIDTVSLFKLWYNLSSMKGATFLIIPSIDRIIEFNIL